MQFAETTESVTEALAWVSEGQEVVVCYRGSVFQLRDCGKIDTMCGIDEVAPNNGDVVYIESQHRYYIRVPGEMIE